MAQFLIDPGITFKLLLINNVNSCIYNRRLSGVSFFPVEGERSNSTKTIIMKHFAIFLTSFYLFLPKPSICQDKVAPLKVKENYWYKNSVIYNLEVGAFKDSDGDGRGDLMD